MQLSIPRSPPHQKKKLTFVKEKMEMRDHSQISALYSGIFLVCALQEEGRINPSPLLWKVCKVI